MAHNIENLSDKMGSKAFHHARKVSNSLPPVFQEGSFVDDHSSRDLDNFVGEGGPYRTRDSSGKISRIFWHGRDDNMGHGNLTPPGHLPPLPPKRP